MNKCGNCKWWKYKDQYICVNPESHFFDGCRSANDDCPQWEESEKKDLSDYLKDFTIE